MVVAIVALVVALSGTAIASAGLVNWDKGDQRELVVRESPAQPHRNRQAGSRPRNVSAAVRGEAPPLLGRDDALGQARAIEALYEAADSGRTVTISASGA